MGKHVHVVLVRCSLVEFSLSEFKRDFFSRASNNLQDILLSILDDFQIIYGVVGKSSILWKHNV